MSTNILLKKQNFNRLFGNYDCNLQLSPLKTESEKSKRSTGPKLVSFAELVFEIRQFIQNFVELIFTDNA